MSEIKTACRGTSRLIEAATMTYEEYFNLHTQGAEELRAAYEALQKENAELKEDLQFVERWANHHGTKPSVTAQEALSCIQHYPSIAAITKSYKDGVIPVTRNPYAELAAQAKRIAEIEAGVVDIRDWTARWTRPDHPIVKVADRLLSASKNGE